MLERTQVLAIHDVGAVLILADFHQLTGSAPLLDQIGVFGERMTRHLACAGQRRTSVRHSTAEVEVNLLQLAGAIGAAAMQLVVPAAGIGASALVGIAMVEITGQQAAARVGNA
jgi:hypothetical protein